jgi:hypothetical protein
MPRLLLALVLLAGCSAPTVLEHTNPGLMLGRPVDVTSRRVLSAAGDRVELAAGVGTRPPRAASVGSWNYDVQGPVNGGPALFTSFTTTTATGACTDMLFVPVNTDSVPNLYALTNLYANCPQGVERLTPQRCDYSAGHCPTLSWIDQLQGRLDGDSAVPSFDGTELYVATSVGVVYALRASAGQIDGLFNANTDLGANDATFVNSTPWVDYPTGNLYVAVSYASNKKGAIYKLDSRANKLASLLLPQGVASTPLYYGGYLYVATLEGRLNKFADTPTGFVAAGTPWPLLVQGSQSIVGTPSIDADSNLIFAVAGDRLGMASLAGDVKVGVRLSAAPGPTLTPSSTTLDLTNHAVFVGHEGKIWRALYTQTGIGTVTSQATRGNAGGNEDPRSSPLVLQVNPSTRYVYIGDGGGFLNRWNADTLDARAQFPTLMPSGIGGPIDGSIFIDYVGGNLYFGGGTGATKIFQVTQIGLN